MRTEIRNKDQYKTSDWSGGKTTELYLFPEGGDYGKRDFKIRISSATVDVEESHFTSLPGVGRNLMILEGNMRLIHKGMRSREMKPYDIDTFSGDWDTTSYGKVRDFNLMVQGDIEASMQYCAVETEAKLSWPAGCGEQKVMLYVIEGSGTVNGLDTTAPQLILLHGYRGEECLLKNTGCGKWKLAVCICDIQ